MTRRFSYHVSRILPVLAAFMVLLAILLIHPALKVWQASAVRLADSLPTAVTQPDQGTLVRTAWSGVTTTLEEQRFWDAPLHSTTVMFLQGQRILQQAVIPGPDDTVHLIVQFRDDPLAVYIQRTGHVPGRFTASELDAVRNYAEQLAATRRQALVEMQQQGIRAEVNHEFRYLFNGMALSVKMRDWQTLKQLPQVKAVEPDYDVRADLRDSVPLIQAPSVWAMTDAKGQAVNGQGVRVAILDTGIDYTHPDLGGGIGPTYKVIGGYDFINNDADPMDDNGHGTHVAGIVAANGVLKGVAPGASLLAFKVLDANGRGQTSTIIAGLERAADPDDGVARKALTVAASDKYDTLADFSSRGPVPGYADVIKPDITAPGVSIQSTVPLYGPLGSPTRYRSLDGTSMATPHVAGAAALIRQLHPDWAPELIKVNLMNTAKNLGRGMFEQGTGRVDVYAAARAPATILPGSVAFGWDDLDQSVWSVSRTLTITNRSASVSTFALSLSGMLPAGITVTLGPSNVTLEPGESRAIVASLSVDNGIVPDPSVPSHAYEGQIIAHKTPYWRNGSASPRKADPIALMACSGDVLLKEAKSDESFTKSIENLLKSLPLNPADFPNVANVAAASNACCFVWPSDEAAPSANFSMSSAVSPNNTPTFEIVSDKSDAALTASTPILTAIAPAAAATAAKANPAFLLKSPILIMVHSTRVMVPGRPSMNSIHPHVTSESRASLTIATGECIICTNVPVYQIG